jgi:rhamnosyltransferase
MSAVRASVVIPVRNGAAHLRELLPALLGQALPGGLEIVAVDSGSHDESVAVLLEHGVRLLRIPGAHFDHGETRNRGAREARGGVVVFLTQDALPADEHVVRRLVEAVEGDLRIAGAFARQAPREDADPLTRRDLAGWVAASSDPRTVFAGDDGAFDRLPAAGRYALAAFDNVASAIRRDHLLAHPFAASRFGEDVEWGLAMLRRGFGLAYVPDALVVHSHPRSARALFRRNYLGHRLLYRLFGLHTVRGLPHLARALAGTVLGDLATLARAGAAPRHYLAAPTQSLAAVYGQYRGARDEALARPYPSWSASQP